MGSIKSAMGIKLQRGVAWKTANGEFVEMVPVQFIRELAHEIWKRTGGEALENWLLAEQIYRDDLQAQVVSDAEWYEKYYDAFTCCLP